MASDGTHDAALGPLRVRIDALDDEIVRLLAERFQIVREVAAVKARNGIPAVLTDRIEAVCSRNSGNGAQQGLDPAFVRQLYRQIIAEACELEERLADEGRDARHL